MQSLGDTLFSTTQQRVLGLLYGQPHRTFYTKEILRLTGMGVATIKRELDRMVAAGILTMRPVGNQHHYQANSDCPIYAELRGIVLKTFGLAEVILKALLPLKDRVHLAFVYGSLARSTDTQSSDIDLMLIGEELVLGEVIELLQPCELALSRTINPSIYALAEFRSKLKRGNSFLKRVVEQDKLWVIGNDDKLAAIGKPD